MAHIADGTPEWEIHAIEYGRHSGRLVYENFTAPLPEGFDRHDAPMPMSFFVWVLRHGDRAIAVDTGFDRAQAATRSRELVLPVEDGLRALGIAPDRLKDVILTHLHWDHAGNLGLFPEARFHVQTREMAYCTGPCMCREALRRPYSVEDVASLLRRVYTGRVRFHDGTAEIAPGVQVHMVGGHSRGLQIVTVNTRRGRVVLASDAVHYFANIETDAPFPLVDSVADMLDGFDLIRRLAPSQAHIVPGHDPDVLRRYPESLGAHLPGIVRLDAEPVQRTRRQMPDREGAGLAKTQKV
ncbi:N-acyl homoserine lactonase family protein [Ruegeria sediminis]|uniref:N-acyl homoserine lactonase family protein n=1 Tax=Ruegeria sediminis TaxID=2583820 RepID=A0ABY2WTX1_9RHOB|nr:N-acyl homoserine lactonase family protein [Ruegeria sediminis]TMV04220.1 N-acyl homoserine lactonase family protein [Ruegeria sediminis]